MTTINDLCVANSFSPDDKIPMWSNANGVTRALPLSVLTDGFITQDSIAELVASPATETFAAGADFIPGVTLALALANQYLSKNNIEVFFDASFQGPDQFTLIGNALTFISPIPSGVQSVYVRGGATRLTDAPSDGTVTDVKVASGSKLYNRINNTVSVTDFPGCDTTGATDSTAAFIAAKSSIESTGKAGTVLVPAGTYKISSTIANDRSSNAAFGKVSWQGAGSDSTTIVYSGPGILFSLVGGTSSATATMTYIKFSGMTLFGSGAANTFAFSCVLSSFCRFSDIHIEGFDYGFYGQDIDHCLYDMVTFRFNKKGFFARQAPVPNPLSTEPNQLTFMQCQFGSNSDYAVSYTGGAANTFIGCQFEVNGASGPSGYGVQVTDPSYQGGPTLIMDGCYFESNNGVADVILVNTTPNITPAITDATYVFTGCSWNRASTLYYATNSILTNFASPSVVGQNIVVLTGCTFKDFNGYVGSSARPYINYSGVATQTKNNFVTTGCVFQNLAAAPVAVQNPAKCYIEIHSSANQSIPNATPTVWSLDTVGAGFSWVTLPSANAITIPEAGCYNIDVSLTFMGNVAGVCSVSILKNGTPISIGEATSSSIVSASCTKTFSVGDAITVSVNQSSGGAVTIANSGIANSYLTITKMVDG